MLKEIFLDNNATSITKPEVISAMCEVLKEPLNASSVHSFGRKGQKYIDRSSSTIKEVLLADDYEIVFTGSGTEANNLALKGKASDLIIASQIEHKSILSSIEKDSFLIDCDEDGYVKLDNLEKFLKESSGKEILVSVMLVNNETGVIQPIEDVIAIAKKYNATVHVDAIQAIGKMFFDLQKISPDMVSISAHKFGGPQGVGALLFKKDIKLKSHMSGGGQQRGIRAGTEDIASIFGMAKSFELLEDNLKKMKKVESIRNFLEDKIKALSKDSIIYGKKSMRIPNTSLFTMPNVNNSTQLIYFDTNKIAISAGSACSSGKISSSHVLKAMGVEDKDSSCAIRVSLGYQNTKSEIDEFIQLWSDLYNRCSNNSSNLFVQSNKLSLGF